MKSNCNKLAVWKAQKGYKVIVTTIEEILSKDDFAINSIDIVDKAAAVRKYLSSLYSAKQDIYCLFVGDRDELPMRYFYGSKRRDDKYGMLLQDNFVPTDTYFSDVIQKWDLFYDSVGVYTESTSKMKYSPCIYVGRLLCSTASEIDNYFEKLKVYEAFPGNGDFGYLSKGIVTQQKQHLDYPNLIEELGTLSEKIIMKDNQADTFVGNRPKGAEVIRTMRDCGLISLQGHGNPGSVSCAGANGKSYTWRFIKAMESYDDANIGHPNNAEEKGCGIDNLNNWPYPSILYSLSCNIMPFDNCYEYNIKYNMGSAFTVAGKFGGVAVLGNTRTGYDSYNINLEKQFAKTILDCRHIGKAYAAAKVNANMSGYACAAHNIMGDPEFEMWLCEPEEQDLSISFGNGNLTVTGSNLKSSIVSLYDGEGNNIMLEAKTNDMSTVITSDNNFDSSCYLVSVWKTGYLPIIKLFGQNSSITSNKQFIVSDAILGKDVAFGKGKGDYIIGVNGLLQIDAIRSIATNEGFMIKKGGTAEFDCINFVSLNGGTVGCDGVLEIDAKEVIISNGFCVEKGGTLSIDIK